MSLHSYQLFCQIAELGSMVQAARIMCITPSAATHAINNLEKSIGVTLLNRSHNKVTLTPDGEHLYEYFKRILDAETELQDQVDQLHGLEQGSVRLGVFCSIIPKWMPAIIDTYKSRYPSIEISIVEGGYAENLQLLLDNDIDIGFVAMPLTTSKLAGVPLYRDRIMCIGPEDYVPRNGEYVTWKELKEMPLLIATREEETLIEKILDKCSIKPDPSMIISNATSIASLVEHGYGYSLIPELYSLVFQKNISKWPLETTPMRTIGVATLAKRKPTPAMKEMIRTLQEIIRKYPEGVEPL